MPPDRLPTYEVAVVALLVLWNLLANTVVPDRAEIPFSLVAAGSLVLIARGAGVGWPQLGMAKQDLLRGLKVGAVAVAGIALIVSLLGLLSATRELLADGRFDAVGTGDLIYETTARIPFATALGEEVAFRGVLLGMLLAWMRPWRAAWFTSVLFGLWHILPAIAALDTVSGIDIGGSVGTTVAGVLAQVIATAVAGLGFCWLRFRGRHLVAPVAAHAALNAFTFFAGWMIVQNGWP